MEHPWIERTRARMNRILRKWFLRRRAVNFIVKFYNLDLHTILMMTPYVPINSSVLIRVCVCAPHSHTAWHMCVRVRLSLSLYNFVAVFFSLLSFCPLCILLFWCSDAVMLSTLSGVCSWPRRPSVCGQQKEIIFLFGFIYYPVSQTELSVGCATANEWSILSSQIASLLSGVRVRREESAQLTMCAAFFLSRSVSISPFFSSVRICVFFVCCSIFIVLSLLWCSDRSGHPHHFGANRFSHTEQRWKIIVSFHIVSMAEMSRWWRDAQLTSPVSSSAFLFGIK